MEEHMINLLKSLFPARTPILTVDVSRLDCSQALRDRNELELAKAKEMLGSKWILHSDNRVLSPEQQRRKWAEEKARRGYQFASTGK
jgi:hypothetical protein